MFFFSFYTIKTRPPKYINKYILLEHGISIYEMQLIICTVSCLTGEKANYLCLKYNINKCKISNEVSYHMYHILFTVGSGTALFKADGQPIPHVCEAVSSDILILVSLHEGHSSMTS